MAILRFSSHTLIEKIIASLNYYSMIIKVSSESMKNECYFYLFEVLYYSIEVRLISSFLGNY